jgi:hypothetical protein
MGAAATAEPANARTNAVALCPLPGRPPPCGLSPPKTRRAATAAKPRTPAHKRSARLRQVLQPKIAKQPRSTKPLTLPEEFDLATDKRARGASAGAAASAVRRRLGRSGAAFGGIERGASCAKLGARSRPQPRPAPGARLPSSHKAGSRSEPLQVAGRESAGLPGQDAAALQEGLRRRERRRSGGGRGHKPGARARQQPLPAAVHGGQGAPRRARPAPGTLTPAASAGCGGTP